MENKLVYYNMGSIECNKKIFLRTMEKAFSIRENDMEQIVSGYKFLFDSETGRYIQVKILDNGTQIITEITGDGAEEVISVYNEFIDNFFDE